MSQTRMSSFVEQVVNVGSGFVLSALVWQFVVIPVWGFGTSVEENLKITMLFTVVSLARGYAWRRLFNRRARSAA